MLGSTGLVTHAAGAGDTRASVVNPPVAHPTLVDALRSAVDTTSGARPYGADNSNVPCDDRPSASQGTHTGKCLAPLNDPGHRQEKKRKLDDCED